MSSIMNTLNSIMKTNKGKRFNSVMMVVVALLLLVVLSFLVGWFSRSSHWQSDQWGPEGDLKVSQRLLKEIKPDNIREHLKKFTSKPHLVGSEGDREVVEYIADFWRNIGLSDVKVLAYNVLLSYPDRSNPSKIVLYDETGQIRYTTQVNEKILRPDQDQPDVVPPFNAYSPPGNPQGQLVYVNYGRIEDFIKLEDSFVNLKGKICIARYGKIFRADKATIAQKFGCIGLILYTDPKDYSGITEVYPDSWWLPGTGVQRGSLKEFNVGIGDPLTPMYPSIDSAYRIPLEDAGLLKIPVHPIGYDDARVLLQNLAGDEVPENWRGNLNLTYRYGPGFSNPNWSVQMFISTNVSMAPVRNAFGFIRGHLEPDRYVMIGNHHDAWVFGAVDPNSGTSTMLELSRALARQIEQGWKPRRSIMFCAWGAEEYGMIGSSEWVENFGNIARDRAVAYLNVDMSVQGVLLIVGLPTSYNVSQPFQSYCGVKQQNTFSTYALRGKSTPLIRHLLYEVAKQIPNADPEEVAQGRKTMYDTWQYRYAPPSDPQAPPNVELLGSGSDFAPFVTGVGVTCVDMRYNYNPSLGISSYPLYHSVYETFHLYVTYIDPTFKFAVSIGQFWGELARRLADEAVIPFSAKDLAKAVKDYYDTFEKEYKTVLISNGCQKGLEYLEKSVDQLRISADKFQKRIDSMDKSNVMSVRQINDQLMQLERAFIDPAGLPGRPLVKNTLYAPSAHNSYGATSFPGLVDSLFQIDRVANQTAIKIQRWRVVKNQLSVLTFLTGLAASTLEDPTQFSMS